MAICGLDFGTSNSVICAPGKTISEPSVLFFPEKKQSELLRCYFGNEAISHYVASGMKGRFLQSLKSVLPNRDYLRTYIFGIPHTPVDLAEIMLKSLKIKMEAALGKSLHTVVLGRPVHFSDQADEDECAEARVRNAALKCGFSRVSFQLEPIAAAIAYEASLSAPKTVLVADLGGGTTDFTVMKLDPKKNRAPDRRDDILATGGAHIGGDDFDAAIMWHKLVYFFGFGSQYEEYGRLFDFPIHFFTRLCAWYDIAQLKEPPYKEHLKTILRSSKNKTAVSHLKTLIEEDLGFAVFKSIEAAKIAFSGSAESSISFHSPHLDFDVPIERAEFESYIADKVQEIDAELAKTLAKAACADADIDSVFLTGGSSLLRPIQHVIAKRFGEAKIVSDENRFTSVAHGLAICAERL